MIHSQKIFLLSFSLDEKETKNQGKKMLPRTASGWPAFCRPYALR
jgi:hypothetical protein